MFHTTIKSRVGEDISILIKLDNHSGNYLCECGTASDLTVKECQDTKAIFISHTHIDHFIHFDFVLRHQIGIGEKVIICGPKGITEQVQSKIKGYNWNLIEAGAIFYEIREILPDHKIMVSEIAPPKWERGRISEQESQFIFQNEHFTVQHTILDHKTPSIAYLFKEKNSINIDLTDSPFQGGKWIKALKEAFENNTPNTSIDIGGKQMLARELFQLLKVKKGDTVGIIMDHAANTKNHRKIAALFKNCNKVFIESFYKTSDKTLAINNYHSYSTESANIMRQCGVKEAVPVHFSRKYKAEERAELIQEFETTFNGIENERN